MVCWISLMSLFLQSLLGQQQQYLQQWCYCNQCRCILQQMFIYLQCGFARFRCDEDIAFQWPLPYKSTVCKAFCGCRMVRNVFTDFGAVSLCIVWERPISHVSAMFFWSLWYFVNWIYFWMGIWKFLRIHVWYDWRMKVFRLHGRFDWWTEGFSLVEWFRDVRNFWLSKEKST